MICWEINSAARSGHIAERFRILPVENKDDVDGKYHFAARGTSSEMMAGFDVGKILHDSISLMM